MGFSVQSQQLKSIINSTMSELTSITTSNTVQNGTNCTATNSFTLNVGGTGCPPVPPTNVNGGVNLNLFQDSTSKCTLNSTAQTTISANIQNNLKQAFQQALSANSKAVQDFLATATSLQFSNLTTEADLTTAFNNLVDTTNYSSCITNATAQNTGTVNICGIVYGGVNITPDQNASAFALATCAVTQVFNTGVSNTGLAQDVQKVDSVLAANQGGLSSLISALLHGWGLIILGILGILIIGGILLIIVAVAFRPKKTPATTTPSGINNSAQEKLVNQFLQHPELL